MNSFYNRNIFKIKIFLKENQVDFIFNVIEICLLKNKIKQLELSQQTKLEYKCSVDDQQFKKKKNQILNTNLVLMKK